MKKKLLVCEGCKSTFERFESKIRYSRVFCSRKCKKETLVQLICKCCNKSFERASHKIKNGYNYCSVECARKSRGPLNPPSKKIKICETCCREYEIIPSKYLKSRFCSHKCRNKSWDKGNFASLNKTYIPDL